MDAIVTKRGKSGADVAVLLLFAAFMVFACVVTLVGIKIYSDVSGLADENYTARTSLGYVANQVRRAEATAVTEFGGGAALELSETGADGSSVYVTLIYMYDGWLRELYTELGTKLDPDVGLELVRVRDFAISEDAGLVTVTVTDREGADASVTLYPRSDMWGAR